jgi:hypothetical protein
VLLYGQSRDWGWVGCVMDRWVGLLVDLLVDQSIKLTRKSEIRGVFFCYNTIEYSIVNLR